MFNFVDVKLDASLIRETGRGQTARARLLEAAIEVFGEKGPRAASVREIARAAGQNVAAIKYYFGSKEGLYHAALGCIVQVFQRQMGDVLGEIGAFRRLPEQSREEALRLLQAFFRVTYLRLLSRKEVLYIGRLIIREQTQPSAGFQILYDNAFREIHQSLCFLAAKVLGAAPEEPRTIIRTHSLMGQFWFFAIARETILRRLGWRTLEGEHAELVADVLAENIETILCGAAAKTERETSKP